MKDDKTRSPAPGDRGPGLRTLFRAPRARLVESGDDAPRARLRRLAIHAWFYPVAALVVPLLSMALVFSPPRVSTVAFVVTLVAMFASAALIGMGVLTLVRALMAVGACGSRGALAHLIAAVVLNFLALWVVWLVVRASMLAPD